MHTIAESTRLQARQNHVIHASTGRRLRVLSGRIWLTQPNATQDVFLGPGDTIELLQDGVVIGAEAMPWWLGDCPGLGAEYQLFALVEPGPRWVALAWLRRLPRRLGSWGRALAFAPASAR